MTITTLLAVIMGRRIQLRSRLLVQESLNQLTLEGMVRLVLYVVKVTFLIEFIGGTILALRFASEYGWQGVYYGTGTLYPASVMLVLMCLAVRRFTNTHPIR